MGCVAAIVYPLPLLLRHTHTDTHSHRRHSAVFHSTLQVLSRRPNPASAVVRSSASVGAWGETWWGENQGCSSLNA